MRPVSIVRRALVFGGAAACTALAACRSKPAPDARPAHDRDGDVAVGYGTQPREQLSTSVSSLDMTDAEELRVARVEELLQGRMAGVQVIRGTNGEFSLRIRGAGSQFNSGEPLYVIDGTTLGRGSTLADALSGLVPSDIARIDVLKDAGSLAIYGSQGGNGVVLIRTKRQ
jgi:TonB-dependent SusC/RagA subfamily outer membrane receptor